jgi:hypothetical protein
MSNVPMSPSPRLSQLAAVAACALLLAGCGGGGGDAQASQPSVQVAGSGAITPGSSSPPTGFKFCAAEGQRCEFGGTAKIAYGAGASWTSPIPFTNGVNCGNASFADLLPGIRKQCYIESAATTLATAPSVPPPPAPTSTPPVVDMPSAGPVVPLTSGFSAGTSQYRVRATTEMPGTSGGGDFRTVCSPTHMSNDDPIVFPGQPGRAHLHTFFGNTGTNAFSTTSSLLTTGNSSCRGGIANRTAYWVPSMVDTRTNVAVMPVLSHFYYKTGFRGVRPADVRPFPEGLRMIAGDPRNTSSSYVGGSWRFICHNNNVEPNGRAVHIVNCAVGDDLVQEIFFPQCWDGVNLDSPDHKSHMAYPKSDGTGCPSDHPVPFVEIGVNVHYRITEANQATYWRLSSDNYSGPAGYSSHADWWNGWVQSDMESWVRNCINTSKDCHSHLLGDGREIY